MIRREEVAAVGELIKTHAAHFSPKEVDGVELWLSVAEDGAVSLSCTKGGKALKSIPAKLKKNAYVLELKEAEQNLKEQYRRTRKMLEEMMEDGTPLLAHEIANVMEHNPVIAPLLRVLVFKSDTALGFYEDGALITPDGTRTEVAADAEVKIAHALDLYESGTWAAYQAELFEKGIRQPFKQVFRELYVKTADEHGKETSRRYAGHQIQPAKTVALLKTRRWVVDGTDEGIAIRTSQGPSCALCISARMPARPNTFAISCGSAMSVVTPFRAAPFINVRGAHIVLSMCI